MATSLSLLSLSTPSTPFPPPPPHPPIPPPQLSSLGCRSVERGGRVLQERPRGGGEECRNALRRTRRALRWRGTGRPDLPLPIHVLDHRKLSMDGRGWGGMESDRIGLGG